MKVPRIKGGGEDPATIVGFEVEQMLMPPAQRPACAALRGARRLTRQAYIVMCGSTSPVKACGRASTTPLAARKWPTSAPATPRWPTCTASMWCT